MAGKMTSGHSIIPPERALKLVPMRTRPIEEASAALTDLMRGLSAGAQLKEPENDSRAHPGGIMVGLGVSHCDWPIWLHGAP